MDAGGISRLAPLTSLGHGFRLHCRGRKLKQSKEFVALERPIHLTD